MSNALKRGDNTTSRVIAALEANGYVTPPGGLTASFIRYRDTYQTKEIHQVSFDEPDSEFQGTCYVYVEPDDYGTLRGDY